MTDTSNMTVMLSSLAYYDQVLSEAPGNITRKRNLQIVPQRERSHNEIAICNLAALLPFRDGTEYLSSMFEYANALALGAQHLNTGDSSVVSDLQGLPDRCNIRFLRSSGLIPPLHRSMPWMKSFEQPTVLLLLVPFSEP